MEMSRRTSFSLKTSTAALSRSSVELTSSMDSSPFQAIVVSVPRKSKRVASSLAAWLSAFVDLLAVDLAHDVERESPLDLPSPLLMWPFSCWVHPRLYPC